MIFRTLLHGLLVAGMGCTLCARAQETPLDYQIKLDCITKYDGGDYLWFHPRVAPIPPETPDAPPRILMTLQKHLQVSDYYSGLFDMQTKDLGNTWTPPNPRPELAWQTEPGDLTVSVCDVTPGWHAPTGKLLAIGVRIRYNPQGGQVENRSGAREGAYAVYDPKTDAWTAWRGIELPDKTKFYGVAPGCVQWLTLPGGDILLPVYFNAEGKEQYVSTVLKCSFDGQSLHYIAHGDEIALPVQRGACEPSITAYQNRYYMTIRNDEKAYVTVGEDGLHYAPIQPWTFDDGAELGSYNTQQHWITHSDGLFLVYTRRGANNDHIMRHRAPLFIAQVDPGKRCVRRSTERVLIPERGAVLGNFGATAVTANESWVTDAEGMWGEARQRGAEGCVFVARILWSKPNRLVQASAP